MRLGHLAVVLAATLTLGACAPGALKFSPAGTQYPARGTAEQVQVFKLGQTPNRPFVKVGEITGEFQHKKFSVPTLEDATPELKQKAWEAGGDAVVVRRAEIIGTPNPDKPLHLTADVIRWQP
jgi:hypothetical protein